MSFRSDSLGAEERALARIRTAAAQTLAVWPEARAAVLFGSRARGDHRPDSDWDVAFITKDGEQVGPIPPGLPIDGLSREDGLDVQCLALPSPIARRKACAIGHVAGGVIRDGRLLAGIWQRPGTAGEPRRMQPDEYWRLAYNALNRMEIAVLEVETLGKTGGWRADASACSAFVGFTADAAEHLAKAMLGRHGIDYRHSHDLDELARLDRRAGRGGLADAIGSMNGQTQTHHVAPYGGVTATDCRHAIRRFLTMAPLLADEIAAGERDVRLAAGDDGELRSAATLKARERQAALRAAADNIPGAAPEDFIREPLAVLAGARLALADALAGLEESLSRDAGLPSPSPFED